MESSEMLMAMRMKGRRDRTVLGIGFFTKAGIVTNSNSAINGKMDSGLTSESPPNPEGKKGVFVNGKLSRKRTQITRVSFLMIAVISS